jgi:hypothetical protein
MKIPSIKRKKKARPVVPSLQRPATYTPREEAVLKTADRVVVRHLVYVAGKPEKHWEELELFPVRGQTIEQKLKEVQDALAIVEKSVLAAHNAVLYVGAIINRERQIANVSKTEIPECLKKD